MNQNKNLKRKVKFCNLNSDSESDTEQLTKKIKNININKCFYLYKPVLDHIKFKHSDLELRYNYDNKSFGIYATKNIAAGTILCIEKGILGSNEYISKVLESRKDIAKELYPRNELEIFTSNSELHFRNDQLINKTLYNVWEWNSDDSPICYQKSSLLCPFVSKFNHNCFCNAFVRSISSKKINELKMNHKIEDEDDNKMKEDVDDNKMKEDDEYNGYIIIYAIDNIKEGSEVTVSYGFNLGHPSEDPDYEQYEDKSELFDWICGCGKSEKERYLYFRFAYREAKRWCNEDFNEIAQNYF